VSDLRQQVCDNDRLAGAGHSEQDAVPGSIPKPRLAAVMLPELAKRHGSRRFEERGEGYIRLVARLARSITLHDRSLPLTLPLKPEKNREN
jgi:hypothetical protein